MNPNEYLRNLTPELREIIDYISGLIFQQIPNAKEKVINYKLKYSSAKYGSICSIEIKNKSVVIEFTKGVKINYTTLNSINKKELLKNLTFF